ncbi:MAG: hypothetical protein M3209_02780 [Acidobacteriota bacterium]|nr:hypothetical protein [Acidobacteriota bacterium]
MIYKTDNEVKKLIESFENCTVSAKEWTHAAHLTAALWYCLNEPNLETATGKMRDGIFKLNAAHGVPNTPTRGYHETLTIFWMRAVSDFLGNIEDKGSLAELANRVVEAYSDSGLPLKFYSRDRLFSPEARAKYIEPDLAR